MYCVLPYSRLLNSTWLFFYILKRGRSVLMPQTSRYFYGLVGATQIIQNFGNWREFWNLDVGI